MFKLAHVTKAYDEAASFNEQINLFGFIDDQVFLTKSGDVGVVLAVPGVDYECLDSAAIDNLTKRLESAFKVFDANCRIYQYLFKSNRVSIPYQTYANPIVSAAIESRIAHLRGKAASLYSLQIYYVILFEGFRYKNTLLTAIAGMASRPRDALAGLGALLSTKNQLVLIETEIEKARLTLLARARSFVLQVNDFLPARILPKADAFKVLKRMLNFAPLKIENARLARDTFLDCALCESHLECHRGHLRLDDHFLKVLTLKEASAQSFPLIFKRLLEVEANFYVVTEWRKQEPDTTRGTINSRRRHFHNTKRSLVSQMSLSDRPEKTEDLLIDDSKEAQVRDLGEALKELELKGNYFGEFSLSIVIYDLDLARVETACADFYKVFSVHDAQVFEERYNLLNSYLATIPGNYPFNLRRLLISNANYVDYSFLFTLHSGDAVNSHLNREYLAVLETNHRTPYYLNLHHRDVAHTMVLGRTGSGKSFLLNFLITNLQKYEPYTFIFDLGGSFESLTKLFGGAYIRVGMNSPDFSINPFSLEPSKPNLDFLTLFVRVLADANGEAQVTAAQEQDLYHQIENLFEIDADLRTLGTLANTLERGLAARLSKWTEGGQFGFLFDNAKDTLTFSRFQCFDFQGMSQYPQVVEPLLFYILHRANEVIADRKLTHIFKAFFIDEAWVFFRNPAVKNYIVEALKTWRKQNAAMVLSTQSLDELRKSGILDVIQESCPTKIFLSNPDMDRELYAQQFHLNDNEIELVSTLAPKRQMLIKNPDIAKVANLDVDPKSYWIYTNDPFDNRKRLEAFEGHGFEMGLEILAGGQR